METCAKCGQPTVCGHSLHLDSSRRSWRICCLCTAEIIALLDRQPEPTGGAS